MKVLVTDDAFHGLKVGIRGGVGGGQHTLGVENIEALVLHCAHVEVADGDDHVDV